MRESEFVGSCQAYVLFDCSGDARFVSTVFVLGFKFKGGAISGVDYNEILAGLDASFNLSLLTLLPPIVVLVLVLMKNLRFLRLERELLSLLLLVL